MSATRPRRPASSSPRRGKNAPKPRKPDYGLMVAAVVGCIAGVIVLYFVAKSMPTKARSGMVAGLPNSVPIVTSPERTIQGTGDVHGLTFLPDGKGLLVGDREGLRQYDPVTGSAASRSFATSDKGVRAVALSPSGKTVALALAYTKLVRAVHATSEGVDPATLRDAAGEVDCLAFTPNGDRLLGGGAAKKLYVWDAAGLIEEDPGRVFDTTTPAAANAKPRLLKAVPTEGSVLGVAVSPDGALAAVSVGSKILLLDTTTWQTVRALDEASLKFGGVAFSPDGKRVAAAVRDGDRTPAVVWEVATGKASWRAAPLPAGSNLFGSAPATNAAQVVYSPDGRWLAVARADGHVALIEANSGKPRRLFQAGNRAALSLAFSPDSRTLATGSADGSVKLWAVP